MYAFEGHRAALRLRWKFRRGRKLLNAPRSVWVAPSSGSVFRRGVRFGSNHQFQAPTAQPRCAVGGAASVAAFLAMGILFVPTGPLIAIGIYFIAMSN